MTELVLPSCERQCTRADGALPGEGKVPHHARVVSQSSDELLVRALHDDGRVGGTEVVQRHAPQVQRTRGRTSTHATDVDFASYATKRGGGIACTPHPLAEHMISVRSGLNALFVYYTYRYPESLFCLTCRCQV